MFELAIGLGLEIDDDASVNPMTCTRLTIVVRKDLRRSDIAILEGVAANVRAKKVKLLFSMQKVYVHLFRIEELTEPLAHIGRNADSVIVDMPGNMVAITTSEDSGEDLHFDERNFASIFSETNGEKTLQIRGPVLRNGEVWIDLQSWINNAQGIDNLIGDYPLGEVISYFTLEPNDMPARVSSTNPYSVFNPTVRLFAQSYAKRTIPYDMDIGEIPLTTFDAQLTDGSGDILSRNQKESTKSSALAMYRLVYDAQMPPITFVEPKLEKTYDIMSDCRWFTSYEGPRSMKLSGLDSEYLYYMTRGYRSFEKLVATVPFRKPVMWVFSRIKCTTAELTFPQETMETETASSLLSMQAENLTIKTVDTSLKPWLDALADTVVYYDLSLFELHLGDGDARTSIQARREDAKVVDGEPDMKARVRSVLVNAMLRRKHIGDAYEMMLVKELPTELIMRILAAVSESYDAPVTGSEILNFLQMGDIDVRGDPFDGGAKRQRTRDRAKVPV